MLNKQQIQAIKAQARVICPAEPGYEALGPLQNLPGKWETCDGAGFNMISLPYPAVAGAGDDQEHINYRLLVNQYNETLHFKNVSKKVPNRGIQKKEYDGESADIGDPAVETDQFLAALDYEQIIHQVAAEDFPESGEAGGSGEGIHHEPGLWLHMANETTNGFDLARLSTIPHGDSVLALGKSLSVVYGHEAYLAKEDNIIPDINGLPIGLDSLDLDDAYLAPYKHFNDCHFHGFNPVNPNRLLQLANDKLIKEGGRIVTTTILDVDSAVETAGIVNIPFIVKQANAASMRSIFWIQEIETPSGRPKLRLQYSQTVLLDFFKREDGLPGLIRWPHVSINTLEKVEE